MAHASHTDIEEIAIRWAKQLFKITSKNSKTLSKLAEHEEDLRFTVDWRRCHFKHGDPEFKDVAVPEAPGAQVLFQTEFTNRTNQEQEYCFKAERATRSSCDVSIEKGVTKGVSLEVALKTPCEVFEANAGFHKEISVTNAFGQTVEEELVWSVDNTIKVPKKHRAHAKLVIAEGKYDANFTVHTEASGKVHVIITNVRDNNSFVQDIQGNLVEIVRNDNPRGIELHKKYISYDTVGSCSFRFGIKQHVEVSQESIEEEE